MFNQLAKFVGRLFTSPSAGPTAKKVVEHAFRKFPAQHANKAVKAAFKVGVAIGKKSAGG